MRIEYPARVRMCRIDPRILLRLLQHGLNCEISNNPLPPDATIVYLSLAAVDQDLALLIHSEEFEEYSGEGVLPEHVVTFANDLEIGVGT